MFGLIVSFGKIRQNAPFFISNSSNVFNSINRAEHLERHYSSTTEMSAWFWSVLPLCVNQHWGIFISMTASYRILSYPWRSPWGPPARRRRSRAPPPPLLRPHRLASARPIWISKGKNVSQTKAKGRGLKGKRNAQESIQVFSAKNGCALDSREIPLK